MIADPSRCNSTNRQNPPTHQNCRNFLPSMQFSNPLVFGFILSCATPGSLGTHCLALVGYYLVFSGPLGIQLVPGFKKGYGMVIWDKEDFIYVWDKFTDLKKTRRVSPAGSRPIQCNFTTMHSRLFCLERILCLDWNSLFSLSAKIVITFEPMI